MIVQSTTPPELIEVAIEVEVLAVVGRDGSARSDVEDQLGLVNGVPAVPFEMPCLVGLELLVTCQFRTPSPQEFEAEPVADLMASHPAGPTPATDSLLDMPPAWRPLVA